MITIQDISKTDQLSQIFRYAIITFHKLYLLKVQICESFLGLDEKRIKHNLTKRSRFTKMQGT